MGATGVDFDSPVLDVQGKSISGRVAPVDGLEPTGAAQPEEVIAPGSSTR